jgi:hypothetical protein
MAMAARMGVAPAGGPRRAAAATTLAALALLVVALDVTPITNNDLFLHLTTGRVVLQTGGVPRVDDYSALARGRPFTAHEWLAGVVFRLVERAAGLDALILFKTGVALLVAGLLYAAGRRLGAPPEVAVPALALVMILAASRFMERPHIFTFLMTAAWLLVLARRSSGLRGPLWLLPPLQILWANLHGAFLLGPAITGLAAGGALLDSLLAGQGGPVSGGGGHPGGGARSAPLLRREAFRLGGLSAVLLGVSLINPYGADLLRFPFHLTGSPFMEEIYEWLPPFGSAFASTYMARYYVAWSLFGAAVLAAAWWRAAARRAGPAGERSLPPGGIFQPLLFLAFLALSLRMNRNVSDFALATFPGVAAAAAFIGRGRRAMDVPGAPAEEPPPRRAPLLLLEAALLAGLALWFATAGYAYGPGRRRPFGLGLGATLPVAAADYLEDNRVQGNAFNSYGTGAYLVYRLYPAVRVGMDSRNDVYGTDLFREYSRALQDTTALDAMLRRLDATFILLDWPRQGAVQTAAAVRSLDSWWPVYFDDRAVIYLSRDGPRADLVERDGYALLDPSLFRPAALRPGAAPVALAEAERAVRASGGSYIARLMRSDALLALGRRDEAFAEEARILAEAPPLHHVYVHLGLMRLGLGDRPGAAARFRRALQLNPESEAALQGLREADR